jgi:hypothetical protein
MQHIVMIEECRLIQSLLKLKNRCAYCALVSLFVSTSIHKNIGIEHFNRAKKSIRNMKIAVLWDVVLIVSSNKLLLKTLCRGCLNTSSVALWVLKRHQKENPVPGDITVWCKCGGQALQVESLNLITAKYGCKSSGTRTLK